MKTVLDKKISRRTFIKRAVIAGAALVLPVKAIASVLPVKKEEKKIPSLELTAKDLPNGLLTPQQVTNEALAILHDNLKFSEAILRPAMRQSSKELIKIKPLWSR